MKEHLATPAQTVGPFFHFSLTAQQKLGRMAGPAARGERIRLAIRVFDSEGTPAPDAMIELWQADANGKYEHPEDTQAQAPDPDFCGFGRLQTDESGGCVFDTVRPGRVPAAGGERQAPHINVIVLARGVLAPLFTRLYFADDAANAADGVLALVPEDRRETLMARLRDRAWRFDIHLSGDRETVFFDW